MNEGFAEPYRWEKKTKTDGKQTAMRENYLIEPMHINMAINLNTVYVPDYVKQPFKYSTTVLVSNIVANLHPKILKKLSDAAQFASMYSYRQQLKKFRPRLRI